MNDKTFPVAPAPLIEVRDKGLRKNALSFLSNIVIGVASAAPAYSIASALGPIAGPASFATPAIMIVAFIPMLFIAVAYYYLNRIDPDCGTTFSWVTLAMGPTAGWIGGWVLLITNVIVMPSMAVIAGQYSFLLFGHNPSPIEATAAVDRGFDRDLLRRHRAFVPHATSSAGDRIGDPLHLRGDGALEGLRWTCAHRLDAGQPRMVQSLKGWPL